MANLNINWDEVKDGAGRIAGRAASVTKEYAGEAYDMLQKKLDAMEEEKRRNLYIGVAVFCGMLVVLTVVYFMGRKAGRRRALRDAGEWD